MQPTQRYLHVYTNEEGKSTMQWESLKDFAEESMGGDADPQWNLHFSKGKTAVLFAELPANWTGEWHENPQPQWIIPLSGGWWIETQDGQRVELRAGELSFGADQNTKTDDNGNKGHRSGSLDGKACKMMIVQLLEKDWRAATPSQMQKS